VFLNLTRHVVRFLWTGDQLVAKPRTIQDNTTYKHKDKHPCPQRDSNPLSQQPSCQDLRLGRCGH
jgi:hypothetical protein